VQASAQEQKPITVRGKLVNIMGVEESTGWAIQLNSAISVDGKQALLPRQNGSQWALRPFRTRHSGPYPPSSKLQRHHPRLVFVVERVEHVVPHKKIRVSDL
jgi:hypothetical protein